MPYLEKQVELINETLIAKGFKSGAFSPGEINGLAERVYENDEGEADKHYPVIFNAHGEPRSVGIDDRFPFIIYHRLKSESFQKPTEAEYGDGNNIEAKEAAMDLIVYGSRSRLKFAPHSVCEMITEAFPTNISAESLEPLRIDSMIVSLNNTNLDPLSVFREEYSKSEYAIGPDLFLFKVSYKITTQYRKDCVNLCDCLGSKT